MEGLSGSESARSAPSAGGAPVVWEGLSSVVADYELARHEETILREACRTADAIDALQALLEAEGLVSESSQGSRVHPALPELRQQRLVFARLLTALRIPQGEDDGRTQPRVAVRGVYSLRGVS